MLPMFKAWGFNQTTSQLWWKYNPLWAFRSLTKKHLKMGGFWKGKKLFPQTTIFSGVNMLGFREGTFLVFSHKMLVWHIVPSEASIIIVGVSWESKGVQDTHLAAKKPQEIRGWAVKGWWIIKKVPFPPLFHQIYHQGCCHGTGHSRVQVLSWHRQRIENIELENNKKSDKTTGSWHTMTSLLLETKSFSIKHSSRKIIPNNSE